MTEPSDPPKRRRKPASKRSTGRRAPTATVVPSCSRHQMEVRWRDLDAFNHVNNANFLTYLEEARLQWLESLDGEWLTDTSAPVLANATVNFRRPIAWPATVAVELRCARVGRSSITLTHHIVSAKDAEALYSDGQVVMVWVDAEHGKAAELPPAVRKAAEAMLSDEAD